MERGSRRPGDPADGEMGVGLAEGDRDGEGEEERRWVDIRRVCDCIERLVHHSRGQYRLYVYMYEYAGKFQVHHGLEQ